MVKIIELSADEIAKRERFSKLYKIAQEIMPKISIIYQVGSSFRVGASLSERILVTPYNNEIMVSQKEGFDLAMKFAREYESRGESEFTIKKNY